MLFNNADAQKNVVANFVQTLFTDRDGEMKTTGMAAVEGNSNDPQPNQEPSFLLSLYCGFCSNRILLYFPMSVC